MQTETDPHSHLSLLWDNPRGLGHELWQRHALLPMLTTETIGQPAVHLYNRLQRNRGGLLDRLLRRWEAAESSGLGLSALPLFAIYAPKHLSSLEPDRGAVLSGPVSMSQPPARIIYSSPLLPVKEHPATLSQAWPVSRRIEPVPRPLVPEGAVSRPTELMQQRSLLRRPMSGFVRRAVQQPAGEGWAPLLSLQTGSGSSEHGTASIGLGTAVTVPAVPTADLADHSVVRTIVQGEEQQSDPDTSTEEVHRPASSSTTGPWRAIQRHLGQPGELRMGAPLSDRHRPPVRRLPELLGSTAPLSEPFVRAFVKIFRASSYRSFPPLSAGVHPQDAVSMRSSTRSAALFPLFRNELSLRQPDTAISPVPFKQPRQSGKSVSLALFSAANGIVRSTARPGFLQSHAGIALPLQQTRLYQRLPAAVPTLSQGSMLLEKIFLAAMNRQRLSADGYYSKLQPAEVRLSTRGGFIDRESSKTAVTTTVAVAHGNPQTGPLAGMRDLHALTLWREITLSRGKATANSLPLRSGSPLTGTSEHSFPTDRGRWPLVHLLISRVSTVTDEDKLSLPMDGWRSLTHSPVAIVGLQLARPVGKGSLLRRYGLSNASLASGQEGSSAVVVPAGRALQQERVERSPARITSPAFPASSISASAEAAEFNFPTGGGRRLLNHSLISRSAALAERLAESGEPSFLSSGSWQALARSQAGLPDLQPAGPAEETGLLLRESASSGAWLLPGVGMAAHLTGERGWLRKKRSESVVTPHTGIPDRFNVTAFSTYRLSPNRLALPSPLQLRELLPPVQRLAAGATAALSVAQPADTTDVAPFQWVTAAQRTTGLRPVLLNSSYRAEAPLPDTRRLEFLPLVQRKPVPDDRAARLSALAVPQDMPLVMFLARPGAVVAPTVQSPNVMAMPVNSPAITGQDPGIPAATAARAAGLPAQPDLAELVEKLWRKLMRKLSVEQERRGWNKWP